MFNRKQVNKVELGDTAKDSITGFKGVVVSITTWLHACQRVQIQPKELKEDGSPHETQVFDMPQCELISKANDKPKAENLKTGGPSIRPIRANDPV